MLKKETTRPRNIAHETKFTEIVAYPLDMPKLFVVLNFFWPLPLQRIHNGVMSPTAAQHSPALAWPQATTTPRFFYIFLKYNNKCSIVFS